MKKMINFNKEQMYNTINTIANEELSLETARKIIANLVVENSDMKKRIYKTLDKLAIKQARFINENDYVITDLDLDEIMKILDIRSNKSEEIK